jgi:hypothetical protein
MSSEKFAQFFTEFYSFLQEISTVNMRRYTAIRVLVQTITNLSVQHNVLDAYVELILRDSALNVDAVLSLSQWNALGGWTVAVLSPGPWGLRSARPSGEVGKRAGLSS